VKCGEGNTNSPELSLLKVLPLAYHHSHFLAATLDFKSFSLWPFWGHTLFLQLGCFGLDLISCTIHLCWFIKHYMAVEPTMVHRLPQVWGSLRLTPINIP